MDRRFQRATVLAASLLVLCALSTAATGQERDTGRYPWTAEAAAVAGQYLALGKHTPIEAERPANMYGTSFAAAEVLPATAMAWAGNRRRDTGFDDQRRIDVRPPQLVIRGVAPPRYPRIPNLENPTSLDSPYRSGNLGTTLVYSGASAALDRQMTRAWGKWPGRGLAVGISTTLTFAKYGLEFANRLAYDIPLSREWKIGLRHDFVVKAVGLIGGGLGGTGLAVGGSVAADQLQRWGAAEWHRNIRTPSGRAAFKRGNIVGAMTGGWADRARFNVRSWAYNTSSRLFAFAERKVGTPGMWTALEHNPRNLTSGSASDRLADSVSTARIERQRPIRPTQWNHLQPETQRALEDYFTPIRMKVQTGFKQYQMRLQNLRPQIQNFRPTYFRPQTLPRNIPTISNVNAPSFRTFRPRMTPSMRMPPMRRINMPSMQRMNLRP